MRVKPSIVLVLVFFCTACGVTGTGPNPPGKGALDDPATFTATATSPVSVQLSWSGVQEAEAYALERQANDADFEPLGEVPASVTSLEDFPLPGETAFTYRIKAVNSQGSSTGKEASATTPGEIPNPLTVAATFDSARAMSATIGEGGGTLQTADASGAIYTVVIPANALVEDVAFTLTPLATLTGSPLSGGTLGAARLEPEGILFLEPYTFTLELPVATPDDGLLEVAFAFEGSGSEFHLIPSENDAQAALNLEPLGKSKMFTIPRRKSGNQGVGRGTKSDATKQVKDHPPTNPADNHEQKEAFDDLDDLGTSLSRVGLNIELTIAGGADWLTIYTTETSFKAWLEKVAKERQTKNDPSFLKGLEERIWAELLATLKIRLELDAENCVDIDYVNQHIELLQSQLTDPFNQALQGRFTQAYGSGLLEELAQKLNKCWIWTGAATSTISDPLNASLSVEVIWTPQQVLGNIIDYSPTVTIIASSLSTSCPTTLNSTNNLDDSTNLLVDYANAKDKRLSYFGTGFAQQHFTMTCPDSGPVTTFHTAIWLQTPPYPQFLELPNPKHITGTFSEGGITGTWDFKRKAPNNQ